MHGDPRERRKRKGGEEEGKGEKVARGAAAYRLQGLGSGMGPHTHTSTRTQRDGRRKVGKGAKFLETQRPALMASKQSRGGEKKRKEKRRRRKRGCKAPLPSPFFCRRRSLSRRSELLGSVV